MTEEQQERVANRYRFLRLSAFPAISNVEKRDVEDTVKRWRNLVRNDANPDNTRHVFALATALLEECIAHVLEEDA